MGTFRVTLKLQIVFFLIKNPLNLFQTWTSEPGIHMRQISSPGPKFTNRLILRDFFLLVFHTQCSETQEWLFGNVFPLQPADTSCCWFFPKDHSFL